MSLFGKQNIAKKISRYIELRLELVRLDIQEKLIDVIITLFELGVVAALLGGFFIFANLALALFLNHFLDSYFIGFLVVAFLQLLLLLIVWLNRKFLITKFEQAIIKSIYQEEEEKRKKLKENS